MAVVCVLTQRTPEIRRSPKHTYTPATPAWAAAMARRRLRRASLRGWPGGSWEPVRMTGFCTPASRNDSAAAV